MAAFEFDSINDLIAEMEELSTETPKIMQEMVEAGGKAALNAVKLNTPVKSGDLRRSIYHTGGHVDKNGNWYDNVHFDGYDRNGVPNQLKANVLESGRKDKSRKATHFLKKAMKSAEPAIESAMKKVFEQRTGIKNDN